jgi:hypothetical protein
MGVRVLQVDAYFTVSMVFQHDVKHVRVDHEKSVRESDSWDNSNQCHNSLLILLIISHKHTYYLPINHLPKIIFSSCNTLTTNKAGGSGWYTVVDAV